MNESRKTLNKIRELFNMEKIEEEVKLEEEEIKEIKLASAELVDDTMIFWDGELVVNTLVFTDEALTIVVPDGEYEFKDGSIKIIVVEGVITDILEIVTDTEPDTAPSDELDAELTVFKMENSELKKDVEFLKFENESLKSEIESTNKNAKFLLEKIEKIGKEPASTPINEFKQNFNSELSINQRRMLNMDIIKNIKK